MNVRAPFPSIFTIRSSKRIDAPRANGIPLASSRRIRTVEHCYRDHVRTERTDIVDIATALRREAASADERRLLVLAGYRDSGYATLESVLGALAVGATDTTLVGPEDRFPYERVSQANADRLFGTVDVGGLLVHLAPTLEN